MAESAPLCGTVNLTEEAAPVSQTLNTLVCLTGKMAIVSMSFGESGGHGTAEKRSKNKPFVIVPTPSHVSVVLGHSPVCTADLATLLFIVTSRTDCPTHVSCYVLLHHLLKHSTSSVVHIMQGRSGRRPTPHVSTSAS